MNDRLVFPEEVAGAMGIKRDTVRKLMRAEKLPPYDVAVSRRYRGWRASTLAAVGVYVPEARPADGEREAEGVPAPAAA